VYRRPRGLVGIIGTWNYPLLLNGVQIVQALTAGNGVLWKPSELAPSSAAAFFDLLRQVGFPTDLVHLLPATRGQELADADVDHVLFTGSTATGRRLAVSSPMPGIAWISDPRFKKSYWPGHGSCRICWRSFSTLSLRAGLPCFAQTRCMAIAPLSIVNRTSSPAVIASITSLLQL
jgi:hypothetical protein